MHVRAARSPHGIDDWRQSGGDAMNSEAKVLQAIDAAQSAFRRLRGATSDERARIAREALQEVSMAPWSMIAREEEADQHGWLSQMREALQRIEMRPEAEEFDRLVDEGHWAANELERDLRQTVGAR
jgi:hypothetical protein